MNFTTGYILTKAGEALHAKVEAGDTLKLTKMQLGSGTVTTVDDYYERSALVEPQNAMSIAEIQQVTAEKNMCVATAVLTNAAVDTSYMASELGLFAQNTDGTEILYAVSYDDHPSYIASKNDGTDITMKFSMYIVATSEITITLTLPKTAEEIATVAAGYAAQAAESELKAKQLEATANNYLQTTQQAMTLANSYADLSKAWAESATSPDSATDTDSPTGYTQSAKIWAALSKEYAGMNKFKLPIGYYDSVAEMKASETAIVGRPCVTLGYYKPTDGGGAVYIIRSKTDSDVDDGGSTLILDNGNVAQLIIDDTINVKQFGAHANMSYDDTTAFQSALDYAQSHGDNGLHDGVFPIEVYVPKGTYRLDSTVQITQKKINFIFNAENTLIYYNGTDYAFLIKGISHTKLKFGMITASNGGCIHFYASEQDTVHDWYQYNKLYFEVLRCKTDCIFVENTGAGWGNDCWVYGGRFAGGATGVRIEQSAPHNGVDHWAFYNIGIEGIDVGYQLNASDNCYIGNLMWVNNRCMEAKKVIITNGRCEDCIWINSIKLQKWQYVFSDKTRNIRFVTPLVSDDYAYDNSKRLMTYGAFTPVLDGVSLVKYYCTGYTVGNSVSFSLRFTCPTISANNTAVIKLPFSIPNYVYVIGVTGDKGMFTAPPTPIVIWMKDNYVYVNQGASGKDIYFNYSGVLNVT